MREDRVALVAAFIVAGIFAATAAPTLDPRDGIVFPAARAKELLQQCSRGAPTNVSGTWLPQPRQIAELEARLPAALAAAIEIAIKPHYLRQYAGLVIASRKFIYINASPADETYPHDGKSRNGQWRSKPVIVCDGGPAFFGAEYDPETKHFSGFAFNGFP